MMPGNFSTLAALLGFSLLLHSLELAMAMNKMPPPEAKLYPGFSRHCPTGENDCKFTPSDSPSSSLYFKCRENNICFCSRGQTTPADHLVWPVQWNEGRCTVGKGGPCGDDQGLSVQCSSDLSCIQGRCRNSTELNNGRIYQFCNDDIDCQSGLVCREPSKNMEIRIRRCMNI